ncbi:TetR/AcrR family transcriptional regulator [Nonomuraea sp. CA-218870]|uniref:TetR/AcrR family transcriptional regulator n=1 Tax=Nonomuraea sp. CA-218870 TaxID=3239998 RepID=UPI003D8CE68C
MTASRTARERVRAELTREIADIARRRLATEGAGGLSLRAVAREMGMVSSAIYRYFPSRDDLLTTLIIDGYNALGEAVERAEAARPRDDFLGRWLAACHGARDWALAHPHEYALLYGSPVPGYEAPRDTVPARLRDVTVLSTILRDAVEAGAADPPPLGPPPPATLVADGENMRVIMAGVPDALVLRALTSWSAMYGWLSLELFGQLNNAVEDRHTAFDHSMRTMAAVMGLH